MLSEFMILSSFGMTASFCIISMAYGKFSKIKRERKNENYSM